MRQHRGRIAVLIALVNAPLIAYAYSVLSRLAPSLAGLASFRTWALLTAVSSLVLHLGASLQVARWLRTDSNEPPVARAADLLRSFRGQAATAAACALGAWWLVDKLSPLVQRGGASESDIAPLATYGWLGLAILLVLGSLTAVVSAVRRVGLPRSRSLS